MKTLFAARKAAVCVNKILRRILEAACAAIMAVLTLVVLWGVATRYISGGQSVFTDELARMLLIVLTFAGGALAFSHKMHVGVSVLVEKFSPSARKCAEISALAISLIFALSVLVAGGMMLISSSMKSGNMLVTMPIFMWQIYLCVPLGGFFAAMFLAGDILDIVAPDKKDSDK